jgi:hypothetical protein
MTNPNHGVDAATAQRIAELSEEQFDALVADTRPHTPPPMTAIDRAATEAHRQQAAFASKTSALQGLRQQMDEQAGGHMQIVQPSKTPPTQGA